MKDNKILEKVRKLLEITKENGASEGEIENAMKMAQRLIMKYNIDSNELIISPLDIDVLKVENQYKSTEPTYWFWDLLILIGSCYSCRVFRNNIQKRAIYKITGFENDRRITKEIFETILPVIRNLINIRYKEYQIKTQRDINKRFDLDFSIKRLIESDIIKTKRIFTASYITGFLDGLGERLKKDRDEYLQLESEKTQYQLMVIRKEDLINEFVEEQLKPNPVKIRGSQLYSEFIQIGIEDGLQETTSKQLH